jgi:hypothetical protein
MLSDEDYKYSPIIFEVGKLEKNGFVTYLTEGSSECAWGGKSVNADP